MDSFEYLKPGNGFTPVPSETATPQEKQTKGLGEVGSWLYTRATFLDIPGKGSQISRRDGLGFLVKRAWELLLFMKRSTPPNERTAASRALLLCGSSSSKRKTVPRPIKMFGTMLVRKAFPRSSFSFYLELQDGSTATSIVDDSTQGTFSVSLA